MPRGMSSFRLGGANTSVMGCAAAVGTNSSSSSGGPGRSDCVMIPPRAPHLLHPEHDLVRKVCSFSGSCSLGLEHDLVRKVCNFSGSCSSRPQHDLARKVCNFSGSCSR